MKGTPNLFSYSKAVIYSELIFISSQLLTIASLGKGQNAEALLFHFSVNKNSELALKFTFIRT